MAHPYFPAVHASGMSAGGFKRRLRCYSAAFLAVDKPELAATLEQTDKVIMYSGYIRDLQDELDGGGVLIFEVENSAVGKRTHCGVLEFSGDQHGVVYLPSWVMHNLMLEDGAEASLRLRTLPKLRYLRLRPADRSFLEAVADPKAVLEECLHSHTAVTEGDELVVHHADAAYGFHVIQARLENRSCCPSLHALAVARAFPDVAVLDAG